MNNQIFYFLHSATGQSALLDYVILFFAVYLPYLVILCVSIFLLFHHEVLLSAKPFQEFKKKWEEILIAFFSGITAWLLAVVFKFFFQTVRPFDALTQVQPLFSPLDHSFPSGHATFFFALAFSLFFSHRKVGYIFLLFALLISIARIMSGVHFPIDILGGLCLGFIISYLFKKI